MASVPYRMLTSAQAGELAAPLQVSITPALIETLSKQIEMATRNLVSSFQEDDPAEEALFSKEYDQDLERIAADPARALGSEPRSCGARSARDFLNKAAAVNHIDVETRRGASAIGDLAARLRKRPKPRIDASLTVGEDLLFEDLCTTIRRLSPAALDVLPSNEAMLSPAEVSEGLVDRAGVIIFASAFITVVVDRTLNSLVSPSPRVVKRLQALHNKSDRALLDGLRAERKFTRQTRNWLEIDV